MQLASLFGVYALSLLAVLLFAAPAAIFAPSQSGLARGARHLRARRASPRSARGRLWVGRAQAERGRSGQHGHSRARRPGQYRPGRKMAPREQRRDLRRLSRPHQSRPSGLDGIAIVVWPETAVPFLLADEPDALSAIADVLPAKEPHCSSDRRGSSRNATRKACSSVTASTTAFSSSAATAASPATTTRFISSRSASISRSRTFSKVSA